MASPLTLTVDPNPSTPGSTATLSASADQPGSDLFVGAGAAWQCWNGSEWIDTYQIVRGPYGDGTNPVTLEVVPDATTTIPAIGLRIPTSSPIVIPPVPPGTYRIADTAGSLSGFVIVEVR